MNIDWKRPLLGLALITCVGITSAVAQTPDASMPMPPGDHHRLHGDFPALTAEQHARMKAIRDQFHQRHEADRQMFESQLKGILTHDQLALWTAHQTAERQRRAAFEKGMQIATQKLQKAGQPVPSDDHERPHPMEGWGGPMGPGHGGPGWGGPGGPPPPPPGFGGPPPGFGGPPGPHGQDGWGPDLNLTPEQMGQVHVFAESMRLKDEAEMQAMMTQMRAVLTPDQQAAMGRHHHPDGDGPGNWHPDSGPGGPPPPPPPPPQ